MATQKTDFSLSVNINPDTSKVQKTLDHTRFKTNVTLDIDTHMVQDSINNLFQSSRLDGFERINTQIQTGLRGFNQYGEAVNGLIKYTETFKNTIGDVQERVTLLSRNGQVLGQSLNTIQRGIADITTETRQFAGNLNGINTNVTQVTKTTTDTAGHIRQVIKETHEWTDANGRLHQTIRTLNERGEQIAPTLRTIDDNIRNVGNDSQESAGQVTSFGQALSQSFTRLVSYYIADAPIRALRESLSEAITTVKEFDSALIEFKKVSDLTGESLTNYVAKLAEMGEVTGSTMQAMVEASTEFRKSGFSDEDSAKLASIAEKYRNIADEEISAGESASFIIAQMKAFNIEAGQAEHIIDSVNEV